MRNLFKSELIALSLMASFFLTSTALGLEIDEKLTVRLLRLSRTKKTALLNRGLEDGLVVGDHAKFYLTSGVIARGVVVKASPSRSVWAVYRIIDPNQLSSDRVMGIKISTPLKLTEDASRAFKGTQFANLRDNLAIPLEKGADDLDSQLSEEDRNDLVSLGGNPPPPVYTYYNAGIDTSRTLEIYGIAHFSNLTSSSTDEETASAGSTSSINFALGAEKYFAQKNSWLSNFSLQAMIHKSSKEVTAVSGGKTSLDGLEYGMGVSYHFWANPLSYGKLIGYLAGSFGTGTVSDSFESFDADTGEVDPQTRDGDSSFVSVGGGFKYYIQNGFGGRVLIDYYTRSETYAFDFDDGSTTTSETFEKTSAGPRIQFGLGYRF